MKTTHASLPNWNDRNLEQKIDRLYGLVRDLYYYVLQNEIEELDELLASHVPFDDKEEKDVRLIRDMLKEHPNLLNMNCEVGHITGSALVICPKGKNFLLHRHKTFRDKWIQFGGHPEFERDFSLVALREASEESGLKNLYFFPLSSKSVPIDIDVHKIPSSKGRPEHLHFDLRYILATDFPQEASIEETESDELMWVPFENIGDYRDRVDYPLYRFLQKANKLLNAL